jgi:repressor LexA
MENMTKVSSEKLIKKRIKIIAEFYRAKNRMPSYSEIGTMLGLRSKHAVSKLVKRLEGTGTLRKDEKGRLIPLSLSRPVKILGTIEAGFPSPAEEELIDTLSLDEWLIKNRNATFLLKVSGDSMIEAGILPGDMVLIDRSLTPQSGDVIIAEVDGEWTLKFLRKRGDGVTLLPANPKYKPIKPKNELNIAGVVTAVVRKYKG